MYTGLLTGIHVSPKTGLRGIVDERYLALVMAVEDAIISINLLVKRSSVKFMRILLMLFHTR